MKHSQKVKLAIKLAPRKLMKGIGIFQSKAWMDRKIARVKKELAKIK